MRVVVRDEERAVDDGLYEGLSHALGSVEVDVCRVADGEFDSFRGRVREPCEAVGDAVDEACGVFAP